MKKFWRSNRKIIKFVLLICIFWQLAIFFVSILSQKLLPARERFMYNDGVDVVNPPFLWNRANFDGVHYLLISRNGYGMYQQAFFPFYPNLIKSLAPVFGGKDLVAAIFISNVSALFLTLFLYRLILLDFEDKVARKTLFLFLVFPTSFFLAMVYTESIFITLVLSSFYFARKSKWLPAAILGAFASYTRIVGIFLFPALLFEWYQQYQIQNSKFKIQSLVPIFLIPVGLLSYMRFLWLKYQDPLMFLHVQPQFGAGRTGDKIILLYQVFWRYLKMIMTTKIDVLYFSVWLEFLVAIVFIILLYLAFKNNIRKSYLIFSLLSFLTPTVTGTFLSIPRFSLALFPCFIALGLIKNKIKYYALMIIFALLFVICTGLFFRGYWIA